MKAKRSGLAICALAGMVGSLPAQESLADGSDAVVRRPLQEQALFAVSRVTFARPQNDVVLEYSVAVASLPSLDEAMSLGRVWERPDVPFYVVPVVVRGDLYYRVLAGMLPSRVEAEKLAEQLYNQGVKESVSAWDIRPTRFAFLFGEYGSKLDAEAEARALLAQGIPAYTVPSASIYYVYSGGYQNFDEASPLQRRIARAGLDAEFVARTGFSSSQWAAAERVMRTPEPTEPLAVPEQRARPTEDGPISEPGNTLEAAPAKAPAREVRQAVTSRQATPRPLGSRSVQPTVVDERMFVFGIHSALAFSQEGNIYLDDPIDSWLDRDTDIIVGAQFSYMLTPAFWAGFYGEFEFVSSGDESGSRIGLGLIWSGRYPTRGLGLELGGAFGGGFVSLPLDLDSQIGLDFSVFFGPYLEVTPNLAGAIHLVAFYGYYTGGDNPEEALYDSARLRFQLYFMP